MKSNTAMNRGVKAEIYPLRFCCFTGIDRLRDGGAGSGADGDDSRTAPKLQAAVSLPLSGSFAQAPDTPEAWQQGPIKAARFYG